jgi:transcriptional regulator of acetoin/glycerol metabolism
VAPTNPESYLELTAPHEVRRHQLLLLLERHEWNVARVARAMGCARMTIYSWLARYGIERRRIRKTKPRIAPAD